MDWNFHKTFIMKEKKYMYSKSTFSLSFSFQQLEKDTVDIFPQNRTIQFLLSECTDTLQEHNFFVSLRLTR